VRQVTVPYMKSVRVHREQLALFFIVAPSFVSWDESRLACGHGVSSTQYPVIN